ncbi:CAP domain-containing protein [Corynebacterium mastitidis]
MARSIFGTKTMTGAAIAATAVIAFLPQAALAHDCEDEHVAEIVRLTNEKREEQGLAHVDCDDELVRGSQEWAEHMREAHDLEHGDGAFSENIPWYGGEAQPDELVDGWMKSAAHRGNMLDSEASAMGVGWSHSEEDGTYAVQRFS